MLNAGVLAFDSAGRIKTITPGAVVRFNGGTPTGDLGSLQVVTSGGTRYNGSLLYDNDGRIVVDPVTAIDHYVQGGLPVTAGSVLAVSYDQSPATWVAGIPLDAGGRVCCATPVAPIALKAYSSAFSPSEFD